MASNAPPPAYSAMDNGEGVGGAPPPSYNSQAPTAPYNPSAPISNPSAPSPQTAPSIKYVDQNGQPVAPPQAANVQYVDQNGNPVNPPPAASIKYVDQNGNPVNPPQAANVKYVDQYGNPVAAPTGVQAQPTQPAIKYVDQYGNPVAAPTGVQAPQSAANIKYVDQYGNPVAPPVGAGGAAAAQPNIKYVDQYGNPVAAPTTATTASYPGATPAAGPGAVVAAGATNNGVPMAQSVKSQRTASAVLGAIALLILFIGLCVNSLSKQRLYLIYDVTWTCGWTEYRFRCGDSYNYNSWDVCYDDEASYADLCDASQDYDSPNWCGTQTAGAMSLVAMLFGTVMCAIGVLLVQPWCKITPCCCKSNPQCGCARISFLCSMLLGISTLIIWYAGDEMCTGENSEMGIGGSMVCQIIGLIFVVISTALARV